MLAEALRQKKDACERTVEPNLSQAVLSKDFLDEEFWNPIIAKLGSNDSEYMLKRIWKILKDNREELKGTFEFILETAIQNHEGIMAIHEHPKNFSQAVEGSILSAIQNLYGVFGNYQYELGCPIDLDYDNPEHVAGLLQYVKNYFSILKQITPSIEEVLTNEQYLVAKAAFSRTFLNYLKTLNIENLGKLFKPFIQGSVSDEQQKFLDTDDTRSPDKIRQDVITAVVERLKKHDADNYLLSP